MPQSPETTPGTDSISEHPYWQLVQRASSSTALKNSPRLLQLFRYLCEHALTAPAELISEQQIGVEIFGREPGYNAEGDTIVRTQVSTLRKKLLQYFLSEGREEPITVEIPPGSYLPVFQPRREQPQKEMGNSTARILPEEVPHARPRQRGLWTALAVLTLVCGWLVWQNWRLHTERAPSIAGTPYVNHLWKQLFDNGRPTLIVTSDGNAMFFSDAMNRPITIEEYRDPDYPSGLLSKWISDSPTRNLMGRFMNTYLTGSQDSIAISRLIETSAFHRIPSGVIYARDFRLEPQAKNVIFLGHAKANPWVALFDRQLNFAYEWHPDSKRGLLRNRKPKAGESEIYAGIPASTTYATVAYLPTSQGTAVLIGGSEMTAVDAGARFLCEEDTIQKLHSALNIDLTQKVPYFEALIVARRSGTVAYEPQLVTVRILEHPSPVPL